MSNPARERSIVSSYDLKDPRVIAGYVLMVLALLAVAFTMLYPFGLTILSSLKTRQEVFTFPPSFLPAVPQWSNYEEAFRYLSLGRPFLNTLIIYIGNATIPMIVVGLAGFSLSQLKLPKRKFFVLFFMCTLMIPSATYLIPSFLNLQSLGLIDSYWALWLPAGANAFNILLLKSFFDGIHKELFEAARMDGSSELRCFFNIAVPLSVPVFVTLLIFTFTGTWNDWYWTSLVITTPEHLPIAPVVYHTIVKSTNLSMNLKFSILSVVMLPPLVFFLVFQKQIIHGLNLSAIKG